MNVTKSLSDSTWSSGNISLSILTNSTSSSPVSHPEVTIMVVLGLSLLLAGLAAFLAVCRPSEQDGDSEAGCGLRDGLRRGSGGSTEPQLKVWKRLGSYRRSYNLSFRRPPPRRTNERESTSLSPGPQTDAAVEPNVSTPCLFDYVTEI
ncbi:uncharacterized protein C10orf105 [Labrus bergylta]|uniref:uncharacterized protein C10orf105 n=1 Tax=Labrus bergylta TaxID=56723 RepID=UPI0009B35141|nr:uncharacterized protein C10orf105-like isoform X2 [Labrus bergylta]XP_029133953.1 uncharacterized protein C10orf105-like isoform X2 [Labrus bergylta]XP_029133954.1 uncharacterized protein C10orf105-like isoform X2 [Labrus bergylta]